MNKLLVIACLVLMAKTEVSAQQFKVITSVESIVPNGLGRSRIISATEEKDYREYTSEQTEDAIQETSQIVARFE
jgi:hypothetical protein